MLAAASLPKLAAVWAEWEGRKAEPRHVICPAGVIALMRRGGERNAPADIPLNRFDIQVC